MGAKWAAGGLSTGQSHSRITSSGMVFSSAVLNVSSEQHTTPITSRSHFQGSLRNFYKI